MNTSRLSFLEQLSTSQRAGLLIAFVVLLAGALISGITYLQLHSQLSQRIEDEQQRQLQHLGHLLTPNLIRMDRISLNLAVSDWNAGHSLNGLRLLDTQDTPLTLRGTTEGTLLTSDITQDGNVYGHLEGYINFDEADRVSGRFAALVIMLTAALSLLSGVIVWLLAERYSRYLTQVEEQLLEWHKGSPLTLPDEPDSPGLQSLHNTLTRIEQSENQKRAVNEALSQFMGNNNPALPDPMKYYDCALLFIEIQDLEVLQSRLSAEELTRTLNQYHQLLTRSAKLYNGTVDRFLGDGIVILFGVPQSDQNAATHCLYAARLFTGLVNHLRDHNAGLLPLEFNIAAHWGPVLMAPLQDSVSTQYSLIGDTIHWAYHLANHSEERRVMVSQTLIEQMQNGHDIIWQKGPDVKDLHGDTQPCFWLDSLPEKTEALIHRQIQHITSMTENV